LFGKVNIDYPLTNINGDYITSLDKANWATFLKNSSFVNNTNFLQFIFTIMHRGEKINLELLLKRNWYKTRSLD